LIYTGEAEVRKQSVEKRRKKREVYLASLADNFPKAWQTAQSNAEVGSGKAYDTVCLLLVDLAEAYRIHSSQKNFKAALKQFMAEHMRRRALVERLIKAGLWRAD